ncbi:MAG: FtsW/RodA/SpoVE family cell cycle protein [Clostridia bacterium]|nr:FtsW/RodA/SpoVE family cell cycle protein [Clostridia bacterium]
MSKAGKFLRETDIYMLFLCIAASVAGIIAVYSATRFSLEPGEKISRDAIVMTAAVVLGFVICLIISAIDYEVILKLWPFVAGASVALMLALFIWGTGPTERSDVITWLPFKIGSFSIYFQPSELLKIAFIITFSVHLELAGDKLDNIVNILLLCAHGAAPTLLVVITGDMGSALVFIMIFAVMMFMAGIKLRYFIAALLTVVAAFPLVWIKVFNDIQRDRFLALIYPESYSDIIYQQLQGKNAIGSGQLTGKGLFKGPFTQNGIVPEAENDMILSVFGEELGFIGCMAVMLLFLLLVFRVIKVAQMANDNPGKTICIGVAAMIASQVIVNVGMCLMLLPCIGITLPFMSAGGSSNLCIYIAMGVVFSVYRFNKDHKPVDFRMINVRTPYR